jgi:hypothetical protein
LGQFPLLDPSVATKLDCPLRIKSAEEIYADSLAQDSLFRLELLRFDSLNINTPTNEEIINQRPNNGQQPDLVYRKK